MSEDAEGKQGEALMMVPGFWMNEVSGVLRPAVEAYLRGDDLTAEQIAALRAYLRQWAAGAWFPGAEIDELRHGVDGLTSRAALNTWLAKAEDLGIDPF